LVGFFIESPIATPLTERAKRLATTRDFILEIYKERLFEGVGFSGGPSPIHGFLVLYIQRIPWLRTTIGRANGPGSNIDHHIVESIAVETNLRRGF
jgi:hypothetical protein